MRAPTAFSAGLLASALVLAACSADQEATTAPSTRPSFFQARKSYTFSLSCNNAGASTVAQVTISVSPTVSGNLAPLNCGGQIADVSNFKSFDYRITLTNQTDQQVAVCVNTRPIRNAGSFTCEDATGQSSAILTVAN
jgi:hypothetical protein